MENYYLKKFEVNEKGRDFVVGDIHGCYDLLMQKLDEQDFDAARDRLFCVGDLCDRGPDSIKCLNLIYEDWFHTAFGNHEWLWTRAHDAFYQLGIFNQTVLDGRINYAIFMDNGGELLNIDHAFTEDDLITFVKDVAYLPRVLEINTKDGRKVGIIHAHMPFDDWEELYVTIETVNELDEKLLWTHGYFKNREFEDENAYRVKNIDEIFHGHTVIHDVIRFANRTYIDTGAMFEYLGVEGRDGKMTILEI